MCQILDYILDSDFVLVHSILGNAVFTSIILHFYSLLDYIIHFFNISILNWNRIRSSSQASSATSDIIFTARVRIYLR